MKDIVEELEEWKLRHEGQSALARLKGTVKKFHKDSQGSARGLVVGIYSLFLPVLFRNTEEIIPSRKRDASELLSNNDYLDAFIPVSMYSDNTSLKLIFTSAAHGRWASLLNSRPIRKP